jgi:putative DNA primase/helicase
VLVAARGCRERSSMPATDSVLYQAPGELRTVNQFVCWRAEERNGDTTKVPYSVHGGRASSTNPKTWAPIEAAIAYAEERTMDGVGFVFTEDDPFAGIDLDKCRNTESGEIEPWAWKIVAAFNSYTEVSPSGTGLHIFVKATLPGPNNRKGPLEMYESGRYFTLTGKHLSGTPTKIHECQDVLERLYQHVFKIEKASSATNGPKRRTAPLDVGDEDLLALAKQAKNGGKFSRLWSGDTSDYAGDDSRADLALCSLLAFWTDGATERMDRLFRQSGLMREKWNRHDYRERTFNRVLEGRTEFYEPGEKSSANENGSQPKKDAGKPSPPTHDELRDRWIEDNPHHAYGLGEWRQYEAGIWSAVSETSVKAEISNVIEAAKSEGIKPTASLLASVTELTRIKVFVPDERWNADSDILVCINGALHISTGELAKHQPKHYATSAVPYKYDSDIRPVIWDYFLRNTVPTAANFLQEFAGYALTTEMGHELAVWLYGPPGSGKSTLIAGLQAMLGHRAGILGLADLERSRFTLADLPGKTLVMASEQPSSYLASTNTLNAIISGEPLQVERKYHDPFTVIPRAKVCWAMNELPRVADANSGLFRRVKVVAFPALAENERDPKIKRHIETEGAGILNWALEGLHRLTQRGHFEIPPGVQDATKQFRENNDVPALFIEDRCVRDTDFEASAAELYREYKYWCEENGHRPQSSTRVAADWQRLGFERKRTMAGTVYQGLRVDD